MLTGVLITVLLMMPSLAPSLGKWIVGAAGLSLVVTLPFSMAVGKAMT